jgi:hypothetical protein
MAFHIPASTRLFLAEKLGKSGPICAWFGPCSSTSMARNNLSLVLL